MVWRDWRDRITFIFYFIFTNGGKLRCSIYDSLSTKILFSVENAVHDFDPPNDSVFKLYNDQGDACAPGSLVRGRCHLLFNKILHLLPPFFVKLPRPAPALLFRFFCCLNIFRNFCVYSLSPFFTHGNLSFMFIASTFLPAVLSKFCYPIKELDKV
jgi:hypothetical protein